VLGPQFGAYGETAADLSVAFTSGAACEAGDDSMPTRRRRVPVGGTRRIGLASMVRNNRIASVSVSPATGLVTLDEVPVSSSPAQSVALNRLYFL
jgi:urease subunit alpha